MTDPHRTKHIHPREPLETQRERLTATANHPRALSRPPNRGTPRIVGTDWLQGGTMEVKGTRRLPPWNLPDSVDILNGVADLPS